MRILMLSSTFPYPPNRGGTAIRTFNLLRFLHRYHSVTLITQRHAGVSDTDVKELRNWVDKLVVFPLPEASHSRGGLIELSGKVGRFMESLIRGTPPNVLHRYSSEIQALVDAYVQTGKYQVITCEHSTNAVYIRTEFSASVLTVVNVHSSLYGWTRNHLEMQASTNVLHDCLYLPVLYCYEKRYLAKFSRVVVTTEDDRQQLLNLSSSSQVRVIPNGVDLEMFPYRPKDPGGHRLIFVGSMDASHNIDAARFFTLEVLPKLRNLYPDTTFTIVGDRPRPEVLALGVYPGVIVTGRVHSTVEYLHQATVCVVPLRTGFGIKNKTLEAMAAGTPVVASDRGLEGIYIGGTDVSLRALPADRVEDYVIAISQLFDTPSLREQLSRNGRALIESEYTWERVCYQYEQALLPEVPVTKKCEFRDSQS
jgi:polysaccharide biosynthesis protein PslH